MGKTQIHDHTQVLPKTWSFLEVKGSTCLKGACENEMHWEAYSLLSWSHRIWPGESSVSSTPLRTC